MKNKTRREIEEYFALKIGNGAYSIGSIEPEYPAWVIRNSNEYGVFVPYEGEDIFENFAGASLKSDIKIIHGIGKMQVLMLTCSEKSLRNEFSLICEEFVSPGLNGSKRKALINNPVEWWARWKALMGDEQGAHYIFDIVAELFAILKLLENGNETFWSATGLSSHDIETNAESYEVKATLNKSKSTIHISSQFQLTKEKPLYLVFTRMEKSKHGKSIDELLNEIEKYDSNNMPLYNTYLEGKGFAKGNHSRKERYRILERRKIKITKDFPKITEEVFVGGKFPDNIVRIEYDVDIEGMTYENWQ